MTLDNFPTTRPSFTANFARSQQMPPQCTFSRATPGTNPSPGTVTGPNGTFLSDYNTPRFAWKDGKCQGLLIEEGSTNKQTYSQDGTQWTLTGGTSKTDNQPGAPDSSSTAVRILSAYTGELKLPSISAINKGGPFIVEYDLAANPPTTAKSAPGLGGYNQSLHYCDVEVLANGWYRIWQGYQPTSFAYSVYVKPDGATTFKMKYDTNQVTLYVDGSSTTGGYFWGGQLEDKSFPTSYIPTSGATATRATDIAQIRDQNMTSWYNQSEGTFAFEFNAPNQLSATALLVWTARSTNSVARWDFFTGNSGTSAATFDSSNGRACEFLTRTQAVSGKYAWAAEKDSFALSQNGNAALTDNSGDMNSTNQITTLLFGTGSYLNGTISRISYYPTRLPNAALEALTQ